MLLSDTIEMSHQHSILFAFRTIFSKEITIEDISNPHKQKSVYALLLKNLIDIGSVTMQLHGKPRDGTLLTAQFLFYKCPDVYHNEYKK